MVERDREKERDRALERERAKKSASERERARAWEQDIEYIINYSFSDELKLPSDWTETPS